MIDLLRYNIKDDTINCLNKGFVRIVDVMPRISEDDSITTCDFAITQAARVSYGSGTKKVSEDKDLIRYLLRNSHTSPFEMTELKFHMKMPMFVARQIIRHRTANVNEISARYSVMKEDYWLPDRTRVQSIKNKQCSEGKSEYNLWNVLQKQSEDAYQVYQDAINNGVAREQARALLPVNFYTEWYWKIDLHNLMHFMRLRLHKHAQEETRVYAEAVYAFCQRLFPITMQAFKDYVLDSIKLSRLETEALVSVNPNVAFCPLNCTNKREGSEWEEKFNIITGEPY